MIRCVVDTNVFINAIFGKGFIDDEKILDLEENGKIKFILSDLTANELYTIFARTIGEKGIFESEAYFNNLNDIIRRSSRIEKPKKLPQISSDKGDQPFIELAVAANADYLITNDTSNGLIDLKEHQGVKIVKPSKFVKETKRRNRNAARVYIPSSNKTKGLGK